MIPNPAIPVPPHMRRSLRVFIGSSSEALGLLNQVAALLEGLGHIPVAWNDPGVFVPGSYTLPRLAEVAREVDAAVLIVGDEDSTWYRGSLVGKARDNVVLEYGLFAGILGERRAVIFQYGEPTHPTDLAGMTVVNFNKVREAKLRAAAWLDQLDVFTTAQVLQGRWLKIGPSGYHFSVQFHADHSLVETALFTDAKHHGSWRIEHGVLHMEVDVYHLSIFPSSNGRVFRGTEVVRGLPHSPPAVFTVLHVPYIAGS